MTLDMRLESHRYSDTAPVLAHPCQFAIGMRIAPPREHRDR